jgi:hypothetical protein
MFSVATVLIYAVFKHSVTYPQEFEDIGLTFYATISVSNTKNKFTDKIKASRKTGPKS